MAKIQKTLACLIWVVIICCVEVLAKKSPRPISDTEVREKKQNCYSDIELGYWGKECKSSMVAKENCALRCLSPACYELIYESDPLEEGEKDYVRSQEYKYCMHRELRGNKWFYHPKKASPLCERLSLGESLDGVKGSFQ